MKILLTGASGFLGNIINKTLAVNKIVTLSRFDADIICDLSLNVPNLHDFDIVIHAAGLAHFVSNTITEADLFFKVNVTGTENLLKGLDRLAKPPESFVYISSVSVYGLRQGISINEDEPLIASDPYGLSKIHAENIVANWCKKNDVKCLILRLPLVASANPPGNLRSMIMGIKRGYYFNIACNKAKKSIVLAQDVANIILDGAKIGGIYNLTDGYHPTFRELSEMIAKQLHKGLPLNIPFWLAYILARMGDLIGNNAPLNSHKLLKITSTLSFDDSKARKILGWNPTPVLEGFSIT